MAKFITILSPDQSGDAFLKKTYPAVAVSTRRGV